MRGQTNLRYLVRRGVGPAHQHIKVRAAAIVAFHAPITGRSVGRDSAVIEFLRGTRRLNSPHPRIVPPWDLPTVLKALKGPPFEPLQSTSHRALSLKSEQLFFGFGNRATGGPVTKQGISRWLVDAVKKKKKKKKKKIKLR